MAPKRWIDKKSAETYTVKHRSYDDPLYNDSDATEHVLVRVNNLNDKDAKRERKNKWLVPGLSDLEQMNDQFKEQGRRENEGEAALYGIAYDDSGYDYMQHLKPMGEDPSAIFIAKKDLERKPKSGGIQFKEHLIPDELMPSKDKVQRSYQDQQNIPDEIAGLQPDMDPHLRQVLEALDDEEFVDEEDENLFDELVHSGQVEDEDEWDMDEMENEIGQEFVEPQAGEEEWETAFRQFKLEESKKPANSDDEDLASDNLQSDAMTTFTTASRATKGNSRRRRKMFKKGVMSEVSGASMSSSALFRNKGLSFMDEKFDKIQEEYDEEDEDVQQFDMKKTRCDFENAMDDFLDNYTIEGKHMYKK